MVKWHINDKGEVGRCSATKGNCPFGGDTGLENHYGSREEAEKSVASSMEGFSNLGTASKKRPTESFQSTKTAIRSSLVEFGIAKTTSLPEVRNTNELIQHWFAGDRKKFESFRNLVNNPTLSPAAKKSVALLLNRGVSVEQVDTVAALDNGKATVDILDDSLRGVSIADIRASRPF
jgi:hypothetical protein